MSETVGLTSGPPETVMGPAPPGAADQLARARAAPPSERHAALARVVRAHPDWPAGWAALAADTTDEIEAYAYYRVGYHRGLDALRKAGWRGSGYVRWAEPDNRGFLESLDGLGRMAEAIGEEEEAERCRLFLRQLDPGRPARSGA